MASPLFIQGALTIVFAVLMIIVFVAVSTWHRVQCAAAAAPTDDEPVPSRLFAPSGLIPSKVERGCRNNGTSCRPRSAGRTPGLLVLRLIDGDNHYRRYVEHRTRVHPDEPVISDREYWRLRHDATGRNPQSRCC